MMERKKLLPVGIDNFEEIRTSNYYYVDKTDMIADFLYNGGKVTLFTRPRRFGKTLNMSMLKAFFDVDGDKSIFRNLNISKETALCEAYMGKYPVIFLSMKAVYAESFDTASALMIRLVREAAKRYETVLEDSPRLSHSDKTDFAELLDVNMPLHVLFGSLKTLSMLLEKHYGKKAIVLIDEYDVPLAKAYEQGYYDEMIILIRNLLEQVLKTNDSLKLAVLTGCMRITKESIFTGLNNLEVHSISEEEYEEYFGFTDTEVRDMLAYYDLTECYDTVRNWYDGYQFGEVSIYCPWDVIRYCKKLCRNRDAEPENFWLNSSGNDIVRKFIAYGGNPSVKGEIEALINGESIEKTIRPDLTYSEMYASIDNLWSVLYTTGYLTGTGKSSGNHVKLIIPNREVRNIFSEKILELFCENVQKDGETLRLFCDALKAGDTAAVETRMNEYLRRTISIRDTAIRNSLKENFYHGILLGILSVKADWAVSSNQEAGDSYSDIRVTVPDGSLAIVIEVKYADNGELEATCKRGLAQIEEKHYADKFYDQGFKTIRKYGMAFHLKKCRVMLAGV